MLPFHHVGQSEMRKKGFSKMKLRRWERAGLPTASSIEGNSDKYKVRVFTDSDLARLKFIDHLTKVEGRFIVEEQKRK